MQSNINYNDLKNKLLLHALKATQQRIVIYEAVLRLDNHPTTEEIYALIRPDNPSVSLGTVYKNLEKFVEAKLIRKVACEDGKMRFDGNIDKHNHFYCTNTHEIIDFQEEDLHQLIGNFLKKKRIDNFEIEDFHLQINGKKIDIQKEIVFS